MAMASTYLITKNLLQVIKLWQPDGSGDLILSAHHHDLNFIFPLTIGTPVCINTFFLTRIIGLFIQNSGLFDNRKIIASNDSIVCDSACPLTAAGEIIGSKSISAGAEGT